MSEGSYRCRRALGRRLQWSRRVVVRRLNGATSFKTVQKLNIENNTPPTVRYNTKKVANMTRGKMPLDPNKVKVVWDNAKHGNGRLGKFNEVTETYNLPYKWWIEFSKEELDILFGGCAARKRIAMYPYQALLQGEKELWNE
ncbi:hypothetical protein QJS10_CPA06g01194 [Acorus calamus]|uniref:Uncharacterized protein n=1 Tax=Acorus calamus TaxID=4465 RepID=A0AAV9EI15_ACOCL|nr:hypothetical protein QJS10_CPA06g01194 [Acorus calamus]